MMLSIVLVALGLGAGWALYGRKLQLRATDTAPDPLAAALPRLHAFLAARMMFDELYAATFGRLSTAFAALSDGMDRLVWDGLVNLVARFGQFAGLVNREADEDGLNAGFDAASEKIRSAGQTYSNAQTGETHGYLRVIALGFVVLVLLVMLGGSR